MDWDGTPVRDGFVSPAVPDRRPVGVFLQRPKVLETEYSIEGEPNKSAGFHRFFFVLKTTRLLLISHGEIYSLFAISFLSSPVFPSLRQGPGQTPLQAFIRQDFRWITVPSLPRPTTPASHGNESAQPKSGIGQ
jgi:hypothetical protein